MQIIISCDGYGDVFEYIRIGAKWKKFLEKLIFLKKFFSDNNKSVHLLVNAVIQRDNIHNIPKLYIFLKKYFQIDIYFEFLVNPPYLSIENIELEKRDKILRLYQEYINKYKDKIPDIEDDFKKIITVIENSSPLENHTKEYYKNTVIIDEYMHSINNK